MPCMTQVLKRSADCAPCSPHKLGLAVMMLKLTGMVTMQQQVDLLPPHTSSRSSCSCTGEVQAGASMKGVASTLQVARSRVVGYLQHDQGGSASANQSAVWSGTHCFYH